MGVVSHPSGEPNGTVFFPVRDHPVNNIPQLDSPVRHRSETPLARDPKQRLRIHVLAP